MMKRIHVVGSGPRTGTTLLAEVMAACFCIDHSCEHESPICTAQPEGGNIFLTKQPGDFASVRLPLFLNPDLYVVCVIRDPRDSVVSSHGNEPGQYWTGLRYWKLFVKTYDKISKHPRFIVLKYEDLVRYPDEVQIKLMEQMPFLNKRHKFTDYHLVAKPSKKSLNALKNIRPIEPKGIGNWTKHLSRVKQQLSIHGSISEDLIRFGYEKDDKWERILDDVNSENHMTVRPEYLNFQDNLKHKKREFIETVNILLRRIGLSPEKYFLPLITVYVDFRNGFQNFFKLK